MLNQIIQLGGRPSDLTFGMLMLLVVIGVSLLIFILSWPKK